MKTELQVVNENVRLSHWKQVIQDCRSSGLSVRAWCHQNGIREQSYYYYLKKIRQMIVDENAQAFVPLVMNEGNHGSSQAIEITKGGIHVQVSDDADFNVVVDILKVLSC